MEQPLIALGGLALLDCINPSALLVTLYLLTGERPAPKVFTYTAGVFASYLALGILLMLGLDAAIDRWSEHFWSPTAFAIQGVIGASMLVYSFAADPKPKNNRLQRLSGATGFAALFALGVLITVTEFSTAIPYFGAVGLLTYMNLPFIQWLLLLVAYNVVFVLPPYLLLGLHTLFSRRLAGRFTSWQEKLKRAGRETALWIIGIVGFYLTIDALVYFDFFGLVPVELPEGLRSPSEVIFNRYTADPKF